MKKARIIDFVFLIIVTLITVVTLFFVYKSINKADEEIESSSKILNYEGRLIDEQSIVLKKGEKITLKAFDKERNIDYKNVTWSSSNPIVVNIYKEGEIIGLADGSATIKAIVNGTNDFFKYNITVKSKTNNVETVKLSYSNLVMNVYEKIKLNYELEPSNVSDLNILWKSSDNSIAQVDDNGTVLALKEGTVTITVTTANNKSAKCKITISKKSNDNVIYKVRGIDLNEKKKIIYEKESAYLIESILPSNATNKNVKWETSNASVAIVDSKGLVTGIKSGMAVVTATTEDGNFKASSIIVVKEKEIPVTEVSLNKTSATLKIGEKLKLEATIIPDNATDKTITWISSNPDIIVDSKGFVVGNKAGDAIISAVTNSGNKIANCKIVVVQNNIPVTDMILDKTSAILKTGDELQLKTTIIPNDAANKDVDWTSTNPDVAYVDKLGKVIAKKIGTATIIAKSIDGNIRKTCTIKVNSKKILITGNSKTYGASDARPSKQFVVLANKGGYLSFSNSTITEKEQLASSYIASNDEVTIVTWNGSTILTRVNTKKYNYYLSKDFGIYDIIIAQEKTARAIDNINYLNGVKELLNLQGSNYNGAIYLRTSFPDNNEKFAENLLKMNKNAENIVKYIRENYNIPAFVIYDGNAIYKAKQKGISVFNTDEIHQNNNGAYLIALCMYVKLYNEDATKVNDNLFTSNSTIASQLKEIANSECK